MTYDLGMCPFVVYDEETAQQAGEWAEEEARKVLEKEKTVNG